MSSFGLIYSYLNNEFSHNEHGGSEALGGPSDKRLLGYGKLSEGLCLVLQGSNVTPECLRK